MKYTDLIEHYIDDMENFGDESPEQTLVCENILKGCENLLLESTNPLLTLEIYKQKLSPKDKEIVDDFIIYCQNV